MCRTTSCFIRRSASPSISPLYSSRGISNGPCSILRLVPFSPASLSHVRSLHYDYTARHCAHSGYSTSSSRWKDGNGKRVGCLIRLPELLLLRHTTKYITDYPYLCRVCGAKQRGVERKQRTVFGPPCIALINSPLPMAISHSPHTTPLDSPLPCTNPAIVPKQPRRPSHTLRRLSIALPSPSSSIHDLYISCSTTTTRTEFFPDPPHSALPPPPLPGGHRGGCSWDQRREVAEWECRPTRVIGAICCCWRELGGRGCGMGTAGLQVQVDDACAIWVDFPHHTLCTQRAGEGKLDGCGNSFWLVIPH